MAFKSIQSAINRIRSKISASVSSARSSIDSVLNRRDNTIKITGIGELQGTITGLRIVTESGELTGAILEQQANKIYDIIQEKIEPISRTGRLKRSYRIEKVSDRQIDIVTDSKYANAIRFGTNKTNVDGLLEWMNKKPEFAGKPLSERRSIAFAIKRSINTGVGSGRTGRSTLRSLNPSGERKFDYIKDAIRQYNRDGSPEIRLLIEDILR